MSLLFDGDYVNPDEPLWLRALGPQAAPANLQLSTLTVNENGGIVMTSAGQPYPLTTGATLAFNREDNIGTNAAELRMAPSKQVPTKVAETTYIASLTTGGIAYDDIALRGLQIYGPQVVQPSANSGCAGYLTRGTTPFSVELYTGNFTTEVVNASIGNFSTLNVSSGSVTVPDPLNVSTINVSTINAGIGSISSLGVSSLTATAITASTLIVSSFSLPGIVNFDNITASTITANVGNFSTLNAPSGAVTTSTVTASSITTGLLSTVVASIKEIFVSTMTFNATLSPNLDLGLGGIIGGLAGGFGANALSVGLGAGGLATGIAALALSRQSGGINPSVFQTVNGTSQLQFSTLGAATTGVLTLTDSVTPTTTPGNPVNVTTIIPSGTYCMRTISDPLNLPNASGTSGLGIQGVSQWTPVYSGKTQLINNVISSVSGNSIGFGDTVPIPGIPNQPMVFNTGPNTGSNIGYFQFNGPILGTTLGLGPTFGSGGLGEINAEQSEIRTSLRANNTFVSTITAYDYNASPAVALSTVGIYPGIITSTLAVSSFAIGNVAFNNFTASTVTASTITVGQLTNTGNMGILGFINVAGAAEIGGGTAILGGLKVGLGGATSSGVLQVAQNIICGTNVQSQTLTTTSAIIPAISGVNTINGAAYPPPSANFPSGVVVAWAAAGTPSGWVLCDGTLYSQTAPLYAALYAAISTVYGGGSGPSAGQFAVPDLRSRTIFGASSPQFGSQYAPFLMVATTFTSIIADVPGGIAPNGITGRQALGLQSVQVGYELAVGMRVNANTGTDQTQRVIIDILNYPGNFGQGGPFIYPNYPIIILNSPFTIDVPLNTAFTVTPVAPYKYTLGLQTSGNFSTQTPYQVAGHTHTQLQGGGGASQLAGGIKAGDLNTSGPQTGGVTQNYYYTMGSAQVGVPATVYNIPTSMATVPSAVAMNWIIKL